MTEIYLHIVARMFFAPAHLISAADARHLPVHHHHHVAAAAASAPLSSSTQPAMLGGAMIAKIEQPVMVFSTAVLGAGKVVRASAVDLRKPPPNVNHDAVECCDCERVLTTVCFHIIRNLETMHD